MVDSKAFSTINILSELNANNPSTGSIVTNGGIGVGGNIFVGEEINAEEIIARKVMRVGKDLYLNGNIIIDNYLRTDNGQIIFKKTLIPDAIQCIGTDKKRWHHVYANNITSCDMDICGSITLGQNKKGEPLFKLDNCLTVNTDFNIRSCDGSTIMKVSQKGKKVKVDDIVVRGAIYSKNLFIDNFISIEPQLETLNNSINQLTVKSSMILLSVDSSTNIVLTYKSSFINSIIRIIVKKIVGELNIEINNDETVTIDEVNQYIDVMVLDDTLIYVGGSLMPN
jgi:hypothetical protein